VKQKFQHLKKNRKEKKRQQQNPKGGNLRSAVKTLHLTPRNKRQMMTKKI
jgi:hypothetical protein